MRQVPLLFLLTLPLMAGAHELSAGACEHGKKEMFLPAPVGDKPGRKYARDRLVDIRHVALDVTPDFAARNVSGAMQMRFAPIALPLAKLQLDAVELRISAVDCTQPLAEWHNDGEHLHLLFKTPVPPDAEVKLNVAFAAAPERGLYFRTPEMGYKPEDTQVWTQGEAELHRFWFPCYDYPNERFTTELTCHVPDPMVVISNGTLADRIKDARGLTAWHWKQDKPHVNYLIAMAAGYFHKVEDRLGDLPLAMHVPPSEREQAAFAFRDTKDIMAFYQNEIGMPFPWAKYDQVYLHDFVAGGMENTSCSFMAGRLLAAAESENLHTVRGLDAHEMAHQWFGDLVTCRDWAHLWLNEGFASYYPILFEEHRDGRDAMQAKLWHEAQRVLNANDSRPMVWRDYGDPMQQFDHRAYPKGAWVLHMLRCQLGPDLFRRAIQHYLEHHQFGNATTDDLQEEMEAVSGRSFDQFFDQWVHHGGAPDLEANYSWDGQEKLARISIRQKQKVTPEVLLFRFPLPVRFFLPGEAAPRDFTVTVSRDQEDFHFQLPAAPEWMRLDPDFTILAKWEANLPPEMQKRILTADFVGRLQAVIKLGERKTQESIDLLKERLNGDAHHEIRREAAESLKKIATDPARDALIASLNQPDARVRLAVVAALATFLNAPAQTALTTHAAAEKNPEILAAIIESWGVRPGDPALAAEVRRWLETSSYNQVLTNAAIRVFQTWDDAAAVPDILRRLQSAALSFESGTLITACEALGFLGRRMEQKDAVRTFLTGHLTHPNERIRAAAAKALGTLGDPAAIGPLTALTAVRKPFRDASRDAAEKALQEIGAQQAGPPELQKLWQELQAVQRKNQDLENQIQKLKEKQPQPPAPTP